MHSTTVSRPSSTSPSLYLDPTILQDNSLLEQLDGMEYRSVLVRGEYDLQNQIALRSQYYDNQYGVHLITPLIISGSEQVVLVDRGWVPAIDWSNGQISQYDETGVVEIRGMLRAPQSKADFGSRSDPTPVSGGEALKAWNFVNIPVISQQLPYTLLPVYIQQAPDAEWKNLPYRSLPQLNITEGSHMSYAIQWFSFAALLGCGYPFFMRKQEKQYFSTKETFHAPAD